MRKVIYPGSFDPITNGHLDIIQRASKLFDEVVVAVVAQGSKHFLFTAEERCHLAKAALHECGMPTNVTIFQGLLVDFVQKQKASAILRGMRAVSDFEFEFQLALMNRKLQPEIETIFLVPKESYTYLSSSLIKEVAQLGGSISSFVPQQVEVALQQKFSSTS